MDETIELSCQKCKSRRHLVAILDEGKVPPGLPFNVYCANHYTEHLKSKIVRLTELVSANKKVSKKG